MDEHYLPLAEHSHLQELVFPQRSLGQGRTPLLVAPRNSSGTSSSSRMVMDAVPQMIESNSSSGVNGIGFGVGSHVGGNNSSSHAMALQMRERSIPVNFQRQQLQALPPPQQLQQQQSRVISAQWLPTTK